MPRCSRWLRLAAVAVVFAHLSLPAFAQDDLHDKIEAAFAKIRPHGLYGNEGAANALLAMAPQMHTARPEFIEALGDKHMVVRWSAARVLGTIGPEAREAVPALATALPTSEWYAQVMIAWAIRRMGPAGKEAVPALAGVLGKSKDVWVKHEVAATLGEIGPEAREALPQLTAALKDPNGFVRVAAAKSLYQIDRDASGVPLLIEALKDYDIVGPRVAADALAKMGEGARPALPALVTTLKDPAPCAQVAAARALWLIDKSTQGVPVLIAALSDEVTEVRERASATLKLIGAATGQTFPTPPTPPAAAKPLVFNAEEWTDLAETVVKDHWAAGKWNLWTSGAPTWSRGVILAASSVTKDRAKPEEGAPVLHTHITGIPAGTYDVSVQHQRALGVSLDAGKIWRKVDGAAQLGTFTIKDGVFDLWVDDRYAASGSPGPHYYNTVTFSPAVVRPAPPPSTPVRGWASQRVCERLSRGLTAIRTADGVYLSWRLLSEDPGDIAFNVYRADGAGKGQLLNTKPITATTDFLDRTAPAGGGSRYNVVPAGKVTSKVPSTAVTVPATDLPYIPIKLDGDYKAQTVGVGDLDGDGRMDYVIKQPDTQIWGFLYTWYRSPGTFKLEAYNADGKFLWRHSMGWGIELGVWFSSYVVHDLDGDGCADVAYKGTDADPRDADGVVNEGREYVVVLNGRTGKEISRAEFPNRDGFGSAGRPGDVAARNQLAIAYLDGKTPCVIAERGTYGLQKVMAYQLKSGKLEILWRWDNAESERKFYGQGAHTLHAADVDGDGRDEVILGSSVLDDTGAPLWSTGMGHPDVCCVGDFAPANPGLEVYYALETPQKKNGVAMVDARTGKVLWGHPTETFHVGSGVVSDVDPTLPGCEAWAAEDPKSGAFGGGPAPRWMYSAAGERLAEGKDVPPIVPVLYWDGDVQRELLRGGQPRDLQGAAHSPNIEGTMLAIADVIGDWREEVITSLPGEIRIYTTTVPATDRRPSLLQDPTYR
ncbi:MAG: HEAT repeat domain-containing protein, partial [Armatimonadia bacterium]